MSDAEQRAARENALARMKRSREALDAVKRKLEEAASRLTETQTRSRVLQNRLADVQEATVPPVSLPGA